MYGEMSSLILMYQGDKVVYTLYICLRCFYWSLKYVAIMPLLCLCFVILPPIQHYLTSVH